MTTEQAATFYAAVLAALPAGSDPGGDTYDTLPAGSSGINLTLHGLGEAGIRMILENASLGLRSQPPRWTARWQRRRPGRDGGGWAPMPAPAWAPAVPV